MKKLVATTLLIVHLFNLAGYPFMFRYLMQRSSQQLSQHIDNHRYHESDLMEIKVALNMPYLTPTDGYERIDGELTVGDKNYSYVKRKVLNDTLYLLCLPNQVKDKLTLAAVDYGKTVNDFDADSRQDNAVKKLNIFNQYHAAITEYSFTSPLDIQVSNVSGVTSILPDSFIENQDRPPELDSHYTIHAI